MLTDAEELRVRATDPTSSAVRVQIADGSWQELAVTPTGPETRVDLVVFDPSNGGRLYVLEGVRRGALGGSYAIPELGHLLLAEIRLPVLTATVSDGLIIDRREFSDEVSSPGTRSASS